MIGRFDQITVPRDQAIPSYRVGFPDGRVEDFRPASFDPGYWHAALGVRERLFNAVPLPATGRLLHLMLPDGGKVEFRVTRTPETGAEAQDVYDFAVLGVIDPHGVRTDFSYPADGSLTLAEPAAAGRSIKVFYTIVSNTQVVDYIRASDGREVHYGYQTQTFPPGNIPYPVLTSVVYYGDQSLTATYTYQGPNVGNVGNFPLLSTCDDSMYAGPMNQISYTYATAANPDATAAVYGQILSENHYNSATGVVGPVVSTLSINGDTRTEMRGDGPSRTFTYSSSNGFLMSWTDFKGQLTSQGRDANGFVSSMTDPRGQSQPGYTTDIGHDARTGNVTSVTYPLTPSDSNNSRGTIITAYNSDSNPYYVVSVTDENTHATSSTRDPITQRVTDINYPDFAHEGFRYNDFGQVTRHQRKNDFYEHSEFDSHGLLVHRWNPVLGENLPSGTEPKMTISYYPPGPWQDRVQTITDPGANATTYEYERGSGGSPAQGRGLVSKIIFPGGKYRTFVYDRVGNKTREENELGQPMEYAYDDYNRTTQVKIARPDPNNLSAQAAPPNQWDITIYDYAPSALASAHLRTARAPTTVTSAAGVVMKHIFDPNLRLQFATLQNPAGEAATTQFHYDPAGNQDWVMDPREKTTTTAYDQRNRRKSSTSPQVTLQDQTTTQYITQWLYDAGSNVLKITLPDTKEINRDYDPMNRLWHDRDQKQRVTTYTYYHSGMLMEVRDPRQQDPNVLGTSFEYDERNLKSKMTYPDGHVVQGWVYDNDGNMTTRPTADPTQTQTLTYDERNRVKNMRWNNGIDFSDFGYDDANRLNYARNPFSTVTREYDVAGRLSLDRQKLAATLDTPAPTIQPTSVVSRQTHGASDFDIALPLTGNPGIESRNGGDSHSYKLVLTFPGPVTVGGARITSGIGTMQGTPTVNGNDVTVNLTSVSNAQKITVQVYGLNDTTVTGEVTVPMQVLIGDANGNGVVSNADLSLVKSQVSAPVTLANFRSDVNGNGLISNADVSLVRGAVGAPLPVAPPGPQVDVSYRRDPDGRMKRLFVPATEYDFTYTFDGMGRLETIYPTIDPPHPYPYYQYYYDTSSNVSQRRNWLNSTAQHFAPDEINRVTERRLNAYAYDPASGEPPVGHPYEFSKETYGYDAMSRLLTTDRTLRSGDDTVEVRRDVFGYNEAGELTSADYDRIPNGQSGFGAPARSVSYDLDNAGNRNGVNDNGTLTGYHPNSLNQYGETTNGAEHEISGYGGVTYHYLADTRLASVTSVTPASAYELGYDALGRCVKRITNGQPLYYAYDGARSIIEYTPGGDVYGVNLYGLGIDEVIARNNNRDPQWPLQDRLGSTSAVSNGIGEIEEQYRYDAFGTPEFRTGPCWSTPRGTHRDTTWINNRILFTGREWVANYNFYEYRARAYNPSLGRFMSEDPMGFRAGDTNLYRYCAGDPVNRSDPSGLLSRQPNNAGMPPPQIRPNEPKNWSANYSDRNGWTQTWGWNGTTIGPGGLTDRMFAAPLGPLIGPWGEHPAGPRDFGPNDHGFGGGRGDGTGGGGGGSTGPRYSGNVTVPWWPSSLTLPYTTPPTAEQAAFTDLGRVPTLIAAAVIFAPLAVPEAVLPYLYSGANAILANPHYIVGGSLAFNQYFSPNGPGANWWEIGGAVAHTPFTTPLIIDPFGP